jgi:membrane protease YdiL (CAAX protease family)
VTNLRLASWCLLVGAVAALNYAAYGTTTTNGEEVYHYDTFGNGLVFYAVVLGLALLIASGRRDLLALRRPASFGAATRVAVGGIVAIAVWEVVVTALPIENPGKEQGLTPSHWEAAHAGAFAANLFLFVVIAPFVEELTFRGVGQSLLRNAFGAAPAIVAGGLAFGAWHGLLVALLVLVPFGWMLAYLRERTGSIVPGMLVHGLFNGAALALAVLT